MDIKKTSINFKKSFNSFLVKHDKKQYLSFSLWTGFIIAIIVMVSCLWAFKNVNWIQKDAFNSSNPPIYNNVKESYGPFRVYSFTMTMGILVGILFTAYNFWKKSLNITDLTIGIIFCIPASLFGASFFGKLNSSGVGQNGSFIELFFFWEGGMAIHGGVMGGVIAGMLVYYIIGRKTRVSMLVYADSIVPNILIGQAIGRWGNFFNHEVAGAPIKVLKNNWDGDWASIESSGLWLPKWITNNVTFVAKEAGSAGNVNWAKDDLVQLSPIFLYESLALFAAWLILMFIVPNITKWISKKPWHENPENYTYDLKFTFKQFFMPWLKSTQTTKSYRDVWNEAYYRNNDEKARENYLLGVKEKNRFKESYRISRANNLYAYSSTKAGVTTFAYFFAWNFVRFILELERPDDHLFIMYYKNLSLTFIFITMLIGIIGMLICQYIAPKYLRRNGYLYEKEYFVIR